MELEVLTAAWRKSADEDALPQLDAATLTQLLARKADDIRQQAKRRVRREATYYLPMVFVALASLADGLNYQGLLMMGVAVVLLAGIVVTLLHAERRLASVTPAGNVRETLANLVSILDAAGRAYLFAYVALFVVSVSVGAGITWFRYGFDVRVFGVLVFGAAAIIWSYRSGRAYVERIFRHHRAELAECLRQLEAD